MAGNMFNPGLWILLLFTNTAFGDCSLSVATEGVPIFTDPLFTVLSDTLLFHQSTDCFLRCTDTPTAVVAGKTYFANPVEITLTNSLDTPAAECTFPDLILSTVSPGDTIAITHVITGSNYVGVNFDSTYSTIFTHQFIRAVGGGGVTNPPLSPTATASATSPSLTPTATAIPTIIDGSSTTLEQTSSSGSQSTGSSTNPPVSASSSSNGLSESDRITIACTLSVGVAAIIVAILACVFSEQAQALGRCICGRRRRP